ncbi:MAG: S1/P1 nuclease [Bacteriovoracia bacterium]
MQKVIHNLWISLWISLFFSSVSWGWGNLGHRMIAEYASDIVGTATLSKCKLTKELLVDHVNDPDAVWLRQRYRFPNEGPAHFFDLEEQAKDWKKKTKSENPKHGYLVYRILDWIDEAKALKNKKNWSDLSIRLYGLAHYLGDITQPLHLTSDYDGKKSGVPGIHSQFEAKMIFRFRDEIRARIAKRISKEKIPPTFVALTPKELIFSIAEQSHLKSKRLIEDSKLAYIETKKTKKGKTQKAYFKKQILWEKTGEMAVDQITLASRLLARFLNLVCE